MKVLTILTDGFEELEAIGTIALLRRSAIEVDICTLKDTRATGRFNITIDTLQSIKNIDFTKYDALLLPGGPHYQSLEEDDTVKEIILHFYHTKKCIAAICAAPTILGRMGLLENKKYTCFTSMNEEFNGTYTNTYTCIDDFLITGKSAAATIEFAFAIITYLQGRKQAKIIQNQIYYENKEK